MASLLDTTGGYVLQLGLAGAQANNVLAEFDTFVNEAASGGIDSAGTIDFGVVVAKGTDGAGPVQLAVPLSATNGSQRPLGITGRMALDSATLPTNVIGYKTGKALPVFRTGDVVCYAAENVSEGDQVCALATPVTIATGKTTNVGGCTVGVANGTTRLAMPGHVWKTTTSSGQLGVVSVFRRDGQAVTTS